MNLALWILQGLLAASFLFGGTLKLVKARLELARKAAWANDYSDGGVKLIGLLEVLGGLGLVLPWQLGIARVLTPVAALGLTALMIGAVGTHLERKDGHFAQALVLGLLSALVAWGRFQATGDEHERRTGHHARAGHERF
jgi:DoxX-like family